MKSQIKKTIYVKYDQQGHPMYPEDTWKSEKKIYSKEDFLAFLKSIYRVNARKSSNFPLNGYVHFDSFSFHIKKTVMIDNEKYTCNKKENIDFPDYFEEAEKEYLLYKERIARTIPKLRKAENKRNTKQRELNTLKRLSEKYGTELAS